MGEGWKHLLQLKCNWRGPESTKNERLGQKLLEDDAERGKQRKYLGQQARQLLVSSFRAMLLCEFSYLSPRKQ